MGINCKSRRKRNKVTLCLFKRCSRTVDFVSILTVENRNKEKSHKQNKKLEIVCIRSSQILSLVNGQINSKFLNKYNLARKNNPTRNKKQNKNQNTFFTIIRKVALSFSISSNSSYWSKQKNIQHYHNNDWDIFSAVN